MSAPCRNRAATSGPDLLDRATHRLVWLLVDIRRALLAESAPSRAAEPGVATSGMRGEGARHHRRTR
ncbi:hypothetical protein [Nocardia sp. CC227C]|uniref:hypothetical protein n=1 Tax=Nocardia sp. CC227C TaxID=3044562 RepID=UPI00278C6C00|nr:hypothetical protein [Nocardia sp. CC227C]